MLPLVISLTKLSGAKIMDLYNGFHFNIVWRFSSVYEIYQPQNP